MRPLCHRYDHYISVSLSMFHIILACAFGQTINGLGLLLLVYH